MSDRSEPEGAPAPAKPKVSNLALRFATAAVGIPIVLWLLFFAPAWSFSAVGLLAAAIAASELAAMTLARARRLQAWMVLATMGVAGGLTFSTDPEVIFALLLGVILAGPLSILLQPDPMSQAGWRMGWMVAGPLYLGGAIAALAKLHHLPDGGVWVVLAMALAWGSDTGGYFAGRAFGRRKLYEKISPKKTVEGAVGGLLTVVAMALGVAYLWLPALSAPHAVALALCAGAAGQAGDLCISVIKRSTGVKDSGKIMPGHGGLLDRIDALMFTAVVTLLFSRWVLGLEGLPPG